MKRLLVHLASLLMISSGAALLTAAPAEAAVTGCITRAEYRAVKYNMTLTRVRRIVGSKGRVTSASDFGDGDSWRTIEFRQCNRSWARSSIYMDFEFTEYEEWVPDEYCDSWGCEDFGWYETFYSAPYRMTSKYAYWW